MLRELNFLLQNIYKTVTPKAARSILTPRLIRMWLAVNAAVIHVKKKRLDYVEIRITDHCNLNCKSCAQFSPLADPAFVDIKTFSDDFQRLHQLTGGDIKTIRLMGGEPLLHPQIKELMAAVRGIFAKSRVVLVTNGILLSKQNDDFWSACKKNNVEILISHYPVKIDFPSLLKTSNKFGVKTCYGTKEPQLMYKWTFDTEGKQNANRNFYKCYFGNNCIQIDNGKLYNCSLIPTVKHFNKYFDAGLSVTPENCIDIYEVGDIRAALEFLAKPVPFCKYCDLNKVQYGKEWEPSKRDIGEWT